MSICKSASDKGPLFKIYKELSKLTDKKMNSLIVKLAKEIQTVNKHMKRSLVSYSIKELQTEVTMRYHYTPIRRVRTQNIDNTKCCQRCGATGTLIHCWCEWKNGTAALEDNLAVSYKTKDSLTTGFRNHAPLFAQRSWKLMPTQKPAHKCLWQLYSKFQNLEATRMFLSKWVDK